MEMVGVSKNEKKDRKDFVTNVVVYLVVIIAVIAFGVCLWLIISKFLDYQESDDVFRKIQDTSVTEYKPIIASDVVETVDDGSDAEIETVTSEQSQETDTVNPALLINWDDFEGTEVVAWFQMDNISYPIMQHSNNSYYLNHLPNGAYNSGGSLFLFSDNNSMFADNCSFVYGHNMYDGSMFGLLKHYGNAGFKDHLFYIYLPDGTRHTYQFFSVASVYQDSNVYTWRFNSDDEYINWQQWMLEQSMFGTSCEASKDARYVILSTCNGYSNTKYRFIICGQEVMVDSLQESASWYGEED